MSLQETRRRYGAVPHYLVPHNFYYNLGLPGYRPRMEQVLALSRVTNYRLAEWLSVFGFNLDRIPALQAEFPNDRTSLLGPTIYDQAAWIEWFEDAARLRSPCPWRLRLGTPAAACEAAGSSCRFDAPCQGLRISPTSIANGSIHTLPAQIAPTSILL